METHNKADKPPVPRAPNVKYDNDFKWEAVSRAKELGISKASRELGVNLNTLKGWVLLSENPHTCNLCEKSFPYESSLKIHLKTHPEVRALQPEIDGLKAEAAPPKERNGKYSKEYKREVAQYALDNCIQVGNYVVVAC